jgi:hypothetical protein
MRNLLLSAILIFGLVAPIGASYAQNTNTALGSPGRGGAKPEKRRRRLPHTAS